MPQKLVRPTRSIPTDSVRASIAKEEDLRRQVEEVCRSWSEVARTTMHGSASGLATQLVGCRSAEEALAACNGWMTSQLAHLIATQHRLIELWCSHVAFADGQQASETIVQRES